MRERITYVPASNTPDDLPGHRIGTTDVFEVYVPSELAEIVGWGLYHKYCMNVTIHCGRTRKMVDDVSELN